MAEQRWEYNVLVPRADLDPWEVEEELNKLGRAGWELVSVENGRYIFKLQVRPRERGRLGNV